MAYDVKSWSMGELCRLLEAHGESCNIRWGWKEDPAVVFGERASWVLYVDLPHGCGQVSFHSPDRMSGPEYSGEWDGQKGMSEKRVIEWCDSFVFCMSVGATAGVNASEGSPT